MYLRASAVRALTFRLPVAFGLVAGRPAHPARVAGNRFAFSTTTYPFDAALAGEAVAATARNVASTQATGTDGHSLPWCSGQRSRPKATDPCRRAPARRAGDKPVAAWARSSVGERSLHTREVAGSKPAAPMHESWCRRARTAAPCSPAGSGALLPEQQLSSSGRVPDADDGKAGGNRSVTTGQCQQAHGTEEQIMPTPATSAPASGRDGLRVLIANKSVEAGQPRPRGREPRAHGDRPHHRSGNGRRDSDAGAAGCGARRRRPSRQHALETIGRIVQERVCPVIALTNSTDPEFVVSASRTVSSP